MNRLWKVVLWACAAMLLQSLFGLTSPVLANSYEINVEVDYQIWAGTDYNLVEDQIDALEAMFDCHDITLNLAIDDQITDLDSCVGTADFGSTRGWGNFDHANDPDWFYCLLVGDMCDPGGNSGVAFPSYGVMMLENDKKWHGMWVFAHELGHLLGLGHGGTGAQAEMVNKVNYPSVMNRKYYYNVSGTFPCGAGYAWSGLNPDCEPFKMLDFSNGILDTVYEYALSETDGLGLGPVDWNNDGVISSGILPDTILLHTGETPSALLDHDDWSFVISSLSSKSFRESIKKAEGPVVCTFDTKSVADIFDSCRDFAYSYCYARNLEQDSNYAEPCYPPYWDTDGDSLENTCDPCPTQSANTCCCNHPGDVNGDGCVGPYFGWDDEDLEYLIYYLFAGGPAPPCLEEADLDVSGQVDVLDWIILSDYYIYGGPPLRCGEPGM